MRSKCRKATHIAGAVSHGLWNHEGSDYVGGRNSTLLLVTLQAVEDKLVGLGVMPRRG